MTRLQDLAHRRPRWLTTLPLLGVAAALLIASVVGAVQQRTGSDAPAAPAGPGEVAIADFAYGPATLTVQAGEPVTWTNGDGQAHTVTSTGGNPLKSGSIAPAATYEITFDGPGTYAYYCSFHPFMKGVVEVTG